MLAGGAGGTFYRCHMRGCLAKPPKLVVFKEWFLQSAEQCIADHARCYIHPLMWVWGASLALGTRGASCPWGWSWTHNPSKHHDPRAVICGVKMRCLGLKVGSGGRKEDNSTPSKLLVNAEQNISSSMVCSSFSKSSELNGRQCPNKWNQNKLNMGNAYFWVFLEYFL